MNIHGAVIMSKNENEEWIILLTDDLTKNANKLKVYDRVMEFLNELVEDLEKDPEHTIQYLERQPKIIKIEDKIVRRLRMGRYRLFYFVDHENKRIVFVDIRIRRETRKTYRF